MRTAIILAGLILAAQTSAGAERTGLVGVWKLLSFESEFRDGSPRRTMYGAHPSGYIIFTREGRMMAVIEGEGRKAPSSDQDRAALLRTMFAYSGKYRVEGDKWITTVDVAWNPAWDGTDQVRSYKLVGQQLTVTSMWQANANFPELPISRGILVFERVR